MFRIFLIGFFPRAHAHAVSRGDDDEKITAEQRPADGLAFGQFVNAPEQSDADKKEIMNRPAQKLSDGRRGVQNFSVQMAIKMKQSDGVKCSSKNAR